MLQLHGEANIPKIRQLSIDKDKDRDKKDYKDKMRDPGLPQMWSQMSKWSIRFVPHWIDSICPGFSLCVEHAHYQNGSWVSEPIGDQTCKILDSANIPGFMIGLYEINQPTNNLSEMTPLGLA